MHISPLAGRPPPADILIEPQRLTREYFQRQPDLADPRQRVAFGTSGHRGTPEDGSFTEAHVLAITQAICEYRRSKGIDGPLFLAKDTHVVDTAAHDTALEVLAANNVDVVIAEADNYTPVPVLSHAILAYNRGRGVGYADGIAVTPSHNPPRDGGFKYNPPTGGPADVDVTQWVQDRANAILLAGNREVKRMAYQKATVAGTTHRKNLLRPYVEDLSSVIDMDVIRSSGLRIAADPLGGAAVHLWDIVRERYKLNLTVVNPEVDFTFRFMRVDHDGQIRMDCSSPYAMAGLVALKDQYQIIFGTDTDADRHGIVTPSVGLLPPNHNLAVAARYLFTGRPQWPGTAMIGKTLVSSSIIDRVSSRVGRRVWEVPVGFKWFVDGLTAGTLGFVGEESAGATLLRRDGRVWTTDKDGPVMGLLACEITARTGQDPGQHYAQIEKEFGRSNYRREDQPATPREKDILKKLSPAAVRHTTLAGEAILNVMTTAPGNHAPIGGLKVVTANGWFAARPSGTEALYKIYAESLIDEAHLDRILREAGELVKSALASR
ncbi:MAG: alpha-D-glucose phosphate-specific phosphoglucomutase [Phycisphaerae bacterium]|nr:alpha-D-glucose phosphate-specific phosphoglucomutase [Phycisphaerae bacterium]